MHTFKRAQTLNSWSYPDWWEKANRQITYMLWYTKFECKCEAWGNITRVVKKLSVRMGRHTEKLHHVIMRAITSQSIPSDFAQKARKSKHACCVVYQRLWKETSLKNWVISSSFPTSISSQKKKKEKKGKKANQAGSSGKTACKKAKNRPRERGVIILSSRVSVIIPSKQA